MPIQLYQTSPPTRDDFLSGQARGRPPVYSDPEVIATHDGVSKFTPIEIAREKARQYRRLGPYLAELTIPDDVPGLSYERTFVRSEGHYTVWGDPETLLGFVVAVHAVKASEEGKPW